MRTRTRASLLAIAALVAAPAAFAVTITRGPYLNTPTASGITIRWRTDAPTSSRVTGRPRAGLAHAPTSTTRRSSPITS